jgi:hypothetical protein
MRRGPSRGRDLRWALILAVLFAYVLCLTYERIELKERNGRIEGLETALQGARSDEAVLLVGIDRACGYAEVHKLAHDKWGMEVARSGQWVLLAADENPAGMAASLAPPEHADLSALAVRLGRIFREGVAQAQSARTGEGGDGSTAR